MAEVGSPEKKKRSPKRMFRGLVEFKGIRKQTLDRYKTNIRQLYDGPAGGVLAIGSMLSLHEPLIGHMLRKRKFDVTSQKMILDVGSGAGQILRHLLKHARPDAHLVGFDLSHKMLLRARKKLKSDRPAYVAGDLMHMPFRDGTFDCVTCGWTIEHLPDPQPGLREIHRVLKPGGSALILATEDTMLGAMVSRTWKCRTYNRKELQAECEEAGIPWEEQLWFTRVHRFFKMGGILVQASKPADGVQVESPAG